MDNRPPRRQLPRRPPPLNQNFLPNRRFRDQRVDNDGRAEEPQPIIFVEPEEPYFMMPPPPAPAQPAPQEIDSEEEEEEVEGVEETKEELEQSG